MLEFLKLLATFGRLKFVTPSFDKASIRASFKFLLPSAIYAVNNNIYLGRFYSISELILQFTSYLAGLILVPPPIWIILCSFRTVVTTCVYKFVLKREVTGLQFTGASMIVMSIVLAKLGDVVGSDGGNVIPALAIVYAVVSSINSVGVSIYQELLFKVKERSLYVISTVNCIEILELWRKFSRTTVLALFLWFNCVVNWPLHLCC